MNLAELSVASHDYQQHELSVVRLLANQASFSIQLHGSSRLVVKIHALDRRSYDVPNASSCEPLNFAVDHLSYQRNTALLTIQADGAVEIALMNFPTDYKWEFGATVCRYPLDLQAIAEVS